MQILKLLLNRSFIIIIIKILTIKYFFLLKECLLLKNVIIFMWTFPKRIIFYEQHTVYSAYAFVVHNTQLFVNNYLNNLSKIKKCNVCLHHIIWAKFQCVFLVDNAINVYFISTFWLTYIFKRNWQNYISNAFKVYFSTYISYHPPRFILTKFSIFF